MEQSVATEQVHSETELAAMRRLAESRGVPSAVDEAILSGEAPSDFVKRMQSIQIVGKPYTERAREQRQERGFDLHRALRAANEPNDANLQREAALEKVTLEANEDSRQRAPHHDRSIFLTHRQFAESLPLHAQIRADMVKRAVGMVGTTDAKEVDWANYAEWLFPYEPHMALVSMIDQMPGQQIDIPRISTAATGCGSGNRGSSSYGE